MKLQIRLEHTVLSSIPPSGIPGLLKSMYEVNDVTKKKEGYYLYPKNGSWTKKALKILHNCPEVTVKEGYAIKVSITFGDRHKKAMPRVLKLLKKIKGLKYDGYGYPLNTKKSKYLIDLYFYSETTEGHIAEKVRKAIKSI